MVNSATQDQDANQGPDGQQTGSPESTDKDQGKNQRPAGQQTGSPESTAEHHGENGDENEDVEDPRVAAAKVWHRRSIVAVAIATALFLILSYTAVSQGLKIAATVLLFLSAFWLMQATMAVFIAKSEVSAREEHEDKPVDNW